MKTILIGEEVAVTTQRNQVIGKIINETKNTITIMDNGKTKIFPKQNIQLKIKNKQIKGTQLVGRISDRIKKKPNKS